ncbi:ABC transporter substrate-binding protein [Chloroflexota bacterium]
METKQRLLVLFSILCTLILLPFFGSCGSTDISIPTSLPTATPILTPTPVATPIYGAFYRNTTYGFSISYPEEWVEEETGERVPIVSIYDPSGLLAVRVLLEYLTDEVTPVGYASTIKAGIEQEAAIELISEKEITLEDGTSGYEIFYTMTSSGIEAKAMMIFVVRGSRGFIIQAFGASINFEQLLDTIDKVVYSFRLEEPKPFGVSRSEALTIFDIDPVTLDPALAQSGESVEYIVEIFSGLVSFDPDMRLVPEIAERWDISNGGKTYTFHLRRGVKFHDGREVMASDFKYSLERVANPATGSLTAETYLGDIVGVKEKLNGEAEEISGVKVLGDYTLEITIDTPKAYFLSKLTYPTAFVVDRANVESGADWWQEPNGSGPFKLKEWQKSQLLILERNDYYYLESPKVGYVVALLWGGVPMQMYENDEIDFTDVYTVDIERVLDPANPLNKELATAPALSIAYIGFNAVEPPFDDPSIRQAFAHAIDTGKIIELVYKNMVLHADGILPPDMPGYNENIQGLIYDVARAKELIVESEYPDVLNFPPVTLTTLGWGTVSSLDAALVDMWRQNLGVEVEIRQLDPEIYFGSIKEEKDELFSGGWGADYPDPQNFLDILFHSDTEQNTGDYSNAEVDSLLEEARVEQDDTARFSLYQQAEQLIINDAAIIPLYFDVSYMLIKPYVKDLPITPLWIPRFRYVSIEPH